MVILIIIKQSSQSSLSTKRNAFWISLYYRVEFFISSFSPREALLVLVTRIRLA